MSKMENQKKENRKQKRREKRKKISIKDIKFERIIFVAIFVFFILKLISQQIRIIELREESAGINKEIKMLVNEIEDLQGKIENKTDIVYIERIARDELNMVRPNEIMYEDEDRPLKDENDK